MSLISSGKTNGVILDVGEGVTHSVPIYGGFEIKHAIVRSELAGKDVTERLSYLLRKSG